MMINTNNYELYVMDYLEGTLDKIKAKDMEAFLLLHPDIAIDIDGIDDLKLPSETIRLEDDFSISLKKNEISPSKYINEENYEQAFIAHAEKDLDQEEEKDLQTFINTNAFLNIDLTTFENIKLSPDDKLIYHDKEDLKKDERKLIILWPSIASIAAILLISFWILQPDKPHRDVFEGEKIESIMFSQISIDIHETTLPKGRKNLNISIFEETTEVKNVIARQATPFKLTAIEKEIYINDELWLKEMQLMQSFAFERNNLYPAIGYQDLPDEKEKSAFRLLSGLFWNTAKGQIKNMSDEIIPHNGKLWHADNIETFTNGYISVKPKTKE